MEGKNTISACLLCLLLVLGLIPIADGACLQGTCPSNMYDAAPDGTCCWARFNLNLSNIWPLDAPMLKGPPSIVDINPDNGNLLIRGALPLVIRDGPGNSCKNSPCMNHSDWHFAYDELNTILISRSMTSQYRPEYFTDAQDERLKQDLRTFNLSDYELIVISFIDDKDADRSSLEAEIREFGGNFSNCSGNLSPGTIRGEQGYLIWSPVGFCDSGELTQDCQEKLYNGTTINGMTEYCSYYQLIDQISLLMQEPSQKKRLIYYHCVLGKDRTGGVTLGYLLSKYPDMTYCDALTYTRYMGKTSGPTNYDDPNKGSLNLASAYCNATRGNCTTTCNKPKPPGQALPGEPDGKGSLYIISYPANATILIDSTDYGTTSGFVNDVPAGVRNLTLTKPGYQAYTTVINIPEGGVKVVSPITLTIEKGENPGGNGTLYIVSYPANATILINGTGYGYTSGLVRNVPKGMQNLTLTKAGYQTYTLAVSVPERGIKVIPPITLSPDPMEGFPTPPGTSHSYPG